MLKHTLLGMLAIVIQATGLVLISGAALADDSTGYVAADGLGIYYAVLPAEMIRGYPKNSPEYTMHGGPPNGEHVHHVMVALFDDKTMERVTDAKVEARVAEIGLPGVEKALTPMPLAGAMSFGNYFHLSNLATYRITIEIRRPGVQGETDVEFEYQHH